MFCHLYCFAAATQVKFFLFQNSNIYVIKIGIRIRDLESGIRDPNPDCKKTALESGIRIRRIFGRIAIPGTYYWFVRRVAINSIIGGMPWPCKQRVGCLQ